MNNARAATLRIRAAVAADLPGLAAIRAAALHAQAGSHYAPEQVAALAEWPGAQLAELPADQALFVASAGAELLGFSSVALDAPAQLLALYVAPGHAGRGLGRALLAAAERHHAAHCGGPLQVAAALNATGFYARHGYTAGAAFVWEPLPGVGVQLCRMRKPFPPYMRRSG